MADGSRPPEATELVYVPGPSWVPAFIAAGLAGLLVGIFHGWTFLVAGAICLLRALMLWIRDARSESERLPRHQRITSAVLPASEIPPAVPLRVPGERG